MMFIVLCLILRTCHQSMLYKLLQADLRRPELQTIDEAIDKNYTFYMFSKSKERLSGSDFMER